MVRAAHSLLSITHSMKLLLLLSDESQISQQRDRALSEARSDAKEAAYKTFTAVHIGDIFRCSGSCASGIGSSSFQ